MIAVEDIEDLTDLTRDEIAAIAEHEYTGLVNAAMLGDYLMHKHHGPQRIQQMICDDIRVALHKDDVGHARELFHVLYWLARTYSRQQPPGALAFDQELIPKPQSAAQAQAAQSTKHVVIHPAPRTRSTAPATSTKTNVFNAM